MVQEIPRGKEVQFESKVPTLPDRAIRPIDPVEKELDYSDVLAEFDVKQKVFQQLDVPRERNAYREKARSIEETERFIVRVLEEAYTLASVTLTIETREKLEDAVLQKTQLETLRNLSDYELRRYADELVAIWGQKQKIWERGEKLVEEEDEEQLAAK